MMVNGQNMAKSQAISELLEVTLEKYLELDKYNREDARLMLNEAPGMKKEAQESHLKVLFFLDILTR
jgi:hypothetical protein